MFRAGSRSLVLAATLAAAACSPAVMRLEPDWRSTGSGWEVTGANPRAWNRPLAFGPYAIEGVREGAVRGFSLRVFGIGAGVAEQPYAFQVVGPHASLDAECHARGVAVWWKGVVADLTATGRPVLACAFLDPDTDTTTTLVLRARADGTYDGALDGALAGTVRSVHRLQGSPLPLDVPAGYEILTASEPAVAVETLNRGRVWMRPGLSDRAPQAAAAAAALLLFRPPEHEPGP